MNPIVKNPVPSENPSKLYVALAVNETTLVTGRLKNGFPPVPKL